MSGRVIRQGRGVRGGQGRFGRGIGNYVEWTHEYKDKEFKVWKYGNGQDKYLATFSKVHDMNIIKIQASYENGIDIAKSIRASEIVYIDGMALEDNISEDTDVKK